MFVRSAVVLCMVIYVAMSAQLLEDLVLPACDEQDCDWCLDCECHTISLSVDNSTSQAADASAHAFSISKMVSNSSKRAFAVTKAAAKVDAYVQKARKSVEWAASFASSASYSVAEAFMSTSCSYAPPEFVGQLLDLEKPIPALCADCQAAFATASALVYASAKAYAEASAFAKAAASASAKAWAFAHSASKATANATAVAYSVAESSASASAYAMATAQAAVLVNCTGVFYNFNLAGKADAQAQAYAISATDAITTADAVASAQVKAAAAAIVEVKVRAKAASKAASLSVAHAKAITVAIAGALAACQPNIPVDK